MSREWKAGDVSAVTYSKVGDEVRQDVLALKAGTAWIVVGGYLHRGDVSEARPLLVIDPEDREQMQALALAIFGKGAVCTQADLLQDIFRDLADPKPPKPDEPTGKWAVVEDAAGATWCRAGFGHATGHWSRVGTDAWADYADIDAVEVLSPGADGLADWERALLREVDS